MTAELELQRLNVGEKKKSEKPVCMEDLLYKASSGGL